MVRQEETQVTGAAFRKGDVVDTGHAPLNVDPAFEVHMLNNQGKMKAHELATRFTDLLTWIRDAASVDSRYLSLAVTKLEEASFYAKKAIAINVENQEH